MKQIILFILMLFTLSIAAQVKPRQLVKGKIIANQNIENVTIYNTTSQKGAISNIDGEFSIYAKTQDTLIIESLVLQTKKIIMKDSDFEMVTLNIKLEEKLNELEEVVVSNNSLTGNLKTDADNIKIHKLDINLNLSTKQTMFEDDTRSSPEIKAGYNFAPDKWGMNFTEIGKKIGKALNLISKPKSKKEDLKQNISYNFKDYTLDNYNFAFFEKELQLPREEIGIFLDFCANDLELTATFFHKNPLEKIDILYQKKKDYDLTKK
jgi:hypothetical protein